MTVREALQSGDFETFINAFAEDAVWVGMGENPPMCTNRDEIRRTMEEWMARGEWSIDPEFVADTGDCVVVDMHLGPPLEGAELHHVFRLRDGKIVRMEDHPARASALAAAGLS